MLKKPMKIIKSERLAFLLHEGNMKPKLFSMPNKMIISSTTGGSTADSFYTGPAPDDSLVSINKTIPSVAATLVLNLTDHGYYNNINVTVNLKNGGSPTSKSFTFDYWNNDGAIHVKVSSVAFDEVVSFIAYYSGLSGQVADLQIQAKDSSGNFINIVDPGTLTSITYPCFFQEINTKNDLISYEVAGVAIENHYHCRTYNELNTLDEFEIEGYTKEVDGETVNKTFKVYSLVRKIRVPGSDKVVAYDFFAKESI